MENQLGMSRGDGGTKRRSCSYICSAVKNESRSAERWLPI